ncbi:SUKH-3 domain-containing protein [Kibdelosporangium persicum]|uniref:SUKH-3 domain-containing protein n=1 Tax=Kibdelosporangium persicum TaxID=2698649 RepID=UPI0015635128|nr:SUKH-3 domain-containing protein [Kibdelosporangium persicum]
MKLKVLPESRLALERSGWSETRQVDVSKVVGSLAEVGYEIDDGMVEILSSFYGLTVEPAVEEGVDFRNEDPLVVDPVRIGRRHIREANDLKDWFKVSFCPLGWWLCRSHVYFSTDGIAIASASGVVWHLGDSFPEAVDFMLTGNRPLVRLWSMDGMG